MAAVRISELHKGAFWIYGVTAMVLHDPVLHVLTHISEAGLANWQVRLELLRCAVLLTLMARFFLAAGLYFDQVYMQEASREKYPRRSYPVDFLAGLMQFLLLLGAAVTVAAHHKFRGELTVFTIAAALVALYGNLWYLLGAVLRYSAREKQAALRNSGNLAFVLAALAYVTARLAGSDPVFADQAALCALLILAGADVIRLIRQYDAAEAKSAA